MAVNVNKDTFGKEIVVLLIARIEVTALQSERQATAVNALKISSGTTIYAGETVRVSQTAFEELHRTLALVNAIQVISGMIKNALSLSTARRSQTVLTNLTPQPVNAKKGTIGMRVTVCLAVLYLNSYKGMLEFLLRN